MIAKLKNFLTSETVVVICLSLIILFFSFASQLYYLSFSSPDTIFPFIHNYAHDYFYYLHLMRQSFEGGWTLISRYTPEDFPARFVYPTFILLGKMARLTGLDLPLTYTFSRLVLAIIFIILIYFIIRAIYPKNSHLRKLSFFFTLFGTGFWTISLTENRVEIGRFLSYWNEINPLERLNYLPHHLSAKILMLFSFLLLHLAIQKKSKLIFSLAILTAFVCGLSSPYILVNLGLIMAITFLLFLLLSGGIKGEPPWAKVHDLPLNAGGKPPPRPAQRDWCWGKILILATTFMAISSLSLFYQRWVRDSGFPWNHYITWEKQVFPIFLSDFLFSLGPNFIFSLFAIPFFLKRKGFLDLLLISWMVEPWLGIFLLSPYLPLQNVRFLSAAQFIPLGIMGSLGLKVVSEKLKYSKIIFPLLLLASTFVFSIDLWANWQSQKKAFSPVYYNIYLPKDLISAFHFLNTNTPRNSIVLSQGFMGNLLPAYSHNKTVIGHLLNTYNLAEKEKEVALFFSQEEADFARQLLVKYKIAYVFYSLDTPPANEIFLQKLGLEKIFANSKATIYKVPQTHGKISPSG